MNNVIDIFTKERIQIDIDNQFEKVLSDCIFVSKNFTTEFLIYYYEKSRNC